MKEKYRIKGKIYYKEAEEQLDSETLSITDGIWRMSNPKGEQFRLLIGFKKRDYRLYLAESGKFILRTTSISRVN